MLHTTIKEVTDLIRARSNSSRNTYLEKINEARAKGINRHSMSCGGLAHSMAACSLSEKALYADKNSINLGIITTYNDVLSAHQPYERYPELIRSHAQSQGAIAQVASGAPAMCDGVTQGEAGMDLSLFSRDVIAMSTAIGFSHNVFDAGVLLGICDKIVPGLLIGALAFGHLPMVFIPSGPMNSGISNNEKARIRNLFAEGKVGREELLSAETRSYHSPGTCTFFGTANSNQMLLEMMGLQLPGSSFESTEGPFREALTRRAVDQALKLVSSERRHPGQFNIGALVNERSIVNAMVGLLATGGSTNHTIHLVAIARAAGLIINWQDFASLSRVVPLLCRIYPNGSADVNHFHKAGGMGFVMSELMKAGLIHQDVFSVMGEDFSCYARMPTLNENKTSVGWSSGLNESQDTNILRSVSDPFSPEGGLRLLTGKLGRAVIKTSAIDKKYWKVSAPARVFTSQEAFLEAFKAGELTGDLAVVVRNQGPKANGMPELHKLTPPLSVMQAKGLKVLLVTDGRMSGASGKVPAAIHLSPEAMNGGPIAKIQSGDVISLDAEAGILDILIEEKEWQQRPLQKSNLAENVGSGRELFSVCRNNAGSAEEGGSFLMND